MRLLRSVLALLAFAALVLSPAVTIASGDMTEDQSVQFLAALPRTRGKMRHAVPSFD